MTILGSIGGVVSLTGLVIWLFSYGETERIYDEEPLYAVGEGVEVAPGVFTYRASHERPEVGLSLTLRM